MSTIFKDILRYLVLIALSPILIPMYLVFRYKDDYSIEIELRPWIKTPYNKIRNKFVPPKCKCGGNCTMK